MRTAAVALLALVTVFSAPVQAGRGRVVYLRCEELAKCKLNGAFAPISGRVDLMEFDVSSGKRSVLAKGLFNGELRDFRESSIVVSHDGRYVAIGQGATIEGRDGDLPDGPYVWLKPNGLHLWNRKTRQIKDIYPEFNFHGLLWSSSSRYLAILGPYSEHPVRIYDALSGRMRDHSGYAEFTCAAWSAKREELIVVVPGSKGGSTVYALSVAGKRRVLFKWGDSIDAIAEFADGSGYALCDSKGVVFYKPNGKTKRLPIYRSGRDLWGVEFQPQPVGSRMAVMSSYAFGEPHINDEKVLYAFRSGGGGFERMARWGTSYLSVQPSGGSITLMSLAGWVRGTSKVVLRGKVVWGGEAVTDNRTDRFVFWTFDVPRGRAGTKVFDTGPGCLSAGWWSGK